MFINLLIKQGQFRIQKRNGLYVVMSEKAYIAMKKISYDIMNKKQKK